MTSKYRSLIPFSGMILLTSIAFVIVWFVNPFRKTDRLEILATKRIGGEVLILSQRYTGSFAEPSRIELYQSLSNNTWLCYYIDHEARYWHAGNLRKRPGTNVVDIYRSRVLVASVKPETFEITYSWLPNHPQKAFRVGDSPLADPDRRPRYLGALESEVR